MTIFDVLTLIGGLSLFLFGMHMMGEALEKSAGSQLKDILRRLTSSRWKAFLLGLGVTAIIQSSSATTVMVVGFVNSGVMTLNQSIGIIMGANVGTTVTAWLLSLVGMEGDNMVMKLLKPSSFTPIIALIGVILVMFQKKERRKDVGMICLGFSVLIYGMQIMTDAVAPLGDSPEFGKILLMFSNPILGVLAGAVLTGIIQSSSASVGILQALSATGQVTFGSAIPIIMGQNIGTCVTAMISSVGTNKNARRAALVHLYFNIFGTIICLSVFTLCNVIFQFSFTGTEINSVWIAIIHSIFNVTCSMLMLPLANVLEKVAYMTIPEDNKADQVVVLDERLLATPAIAIEQCYKVTGVMAKESVDALNLALEQFEQFNEKSALLVREKEDQVDQYEDMLGSYLVKLSSHSMSEQDSTKVAMLLHMIGDMERISDHAVNVLVSAEEIHDKKLQFSGTAQKQLKVMIAAVQEATALALDAFTSHDLNVAVRVEPLEQVVDDLLQTIKREHIKRLQNNECTIELGFILNDLLTNLERVSDHCSNIASCLIEAEHQSLDLHGYLRGLKKTENSEYVQQYETFAQKYAIAKQ